MSLSRTTTTRPRRRGRALLAVVAATGLLAACGDEGAQGNRAEGDETVITCASCQQGEDLFLQYNYDAAMRFNEEYAGRYRIETIANQNAGAGPERLAYFQRLALADDLPDVFLASNQEMDVLLESADLFDFAAALDADPQWRDSYFEDSLATLARDGAQWGIPEVRDAVGIYANGEILEAAGVESYPQSWNELELACEAVKETGATCMAMDGDWVTLLMWAHLIETHPSGAGFLTDRIGANDWAEDEAVVAATERLRDWHDRGFVNVDSLSGDYANAATVYQTGRAAMIANGPWMMGDIRGASSVEGLGDVTTYEVSPGWVAANRGIISITGGAWLSGAQGTAEQEAVAAFMRFLASPDETFAQTLATGSYPPVRNELTPAQEAELDPVIAGLVAESATLDLAYPNVAANASPTFSSTWKNFWPAYIQGEMDTAQFLTRLTDELS